MSDEGLAGLMPFDLVTQVWGSGGWIDSCRMCGAAIGDAEVHLTWHRALAGQEVQ